MLVFDAKTIETNAKPLPWFPPEEQGEEERRCRGEIASVAIALRTIAQMLNPYLGFI
ncbi:hypothetical protein [Pseudanabaena sp. PCC 6802]|uniref:hypothetical protein n=1 Tax=Pseudanabaena sp. PCC 6802 TaxID=118173 RepID=UPI00034B2B05|nr:hypothetical protein [Pseudanabaena sp. PCC 6802]